MIKISNLTRRFGRRIVVDNLTLHINPGEIFGLLGPNGAGKTTTVRMLTTLLRPMSGSAEIAGFDIVKEPEAVKRCIGYSPQEINLDRELTGYQNLFLHSLLYRMKKSPVRCRECLILAGIDNQGNDMVKTYSGGMQRSLQITRSVMHDPSILFLDEPTAGLDPKIRRTIWELIRSLNNKQIGVLLTTHYIEEAELLCSRVGIMNKGRLIACDTPSELKKSVGAIVVESNYNGCFDYKHFQDRNAAHEYAKEQERSIVRIRESTLEDVFIHFTGERFCI